MPQNQSVDLNRCYQAMGGKPDQCTPETLDQVIKAFMRVYGYHNFSILSDSSKPELTEAQIAATLSDEAVFDRMVNKDQAGSCYDLAILLDMLLKDVGFEVFASQSICRLFDRSFSEGPKTHKVSVVRCQQRLFLLDTGFGWGGPYGAVEFFQDRANEVEHIDKRRYRLEPVKGGHRLYYLEKSGEWNPAYDFDSTLIPVTAEQMRSTYRELVGPATEPVTHSLLMVGRTIGDHHRIGIMVDMTEGGPWRATAVDRRDMQRDTTALQTPAEIEAFVNAQLNIDMPQSVMQQLTAHYQAALARRDEHRTLTDKQRELYYQRLGIKVPTEHNRQVLDDMLQAHLRAFPFDGTRLLDDALLANKQPEDFHDPLSDQASFQRLVVDGLGGMCYEHSDLLAMALEDLGFDVRRSRSITRLDDDSFEKGPMNHKLFTVNLSGECFLMDPGLGFFAPYGALPFSRDHSCITETSDGWRFKIESADPHPYFRMSAWRDGKWDAFLDFDADLGGVSKEVECQDYASLVGPVENAVTHSLFMAGRVNGEANPEERRVGVLANVKPNNTWWAQAHLFGRGPKPRKQDLKSPAEVQQFMQDHIGLPMSDRIVGLLAANFVGAKQHRQQRLKAAMLAVLASVRVAGPAQFAANRQQQQSAVRPTML